MKSNRNITVSDSELYWLYGLTFDEAVWARCEILKEDKRKVKEAALARVKALQDVERMEK